MANAGSYRVPLFVPALATAAPPGGPRHADATTGARDRIGGTGGRRQRRRWALPPTPMSNLNVFLLGFIVLTAGLAMGAHLAGVPTAWIGAGGVVMIGLGILLAVTKTRQREDPNRY